jgi:hypothetical protein
MIEITNGIAGLITAIAALVGALATLLVAIKRPPGPPTERTPGDRARKRQRILLLCSGILALIGGGIFIWRGTSPKLLITSPASGLEVTAEGDSVAFPVSGTSSNIASDNSLRIYVLVHSGTEWHVQNPASILPDGRWTLRQAWIGDPSAPIKVGDTFRIMAVASRQQRGQDEKIDDYRQLDPKEVSQEIVVPVQRIRSATPKPMPSGDRR